MTPSSGQPVVLTFYSYESGIGRSKTLAGVALLLAGEGHRVLVVDWDLETPGLAPLLLDSDDDHLPGVFDLVTARMSGREMDWHACLMDVGGSSSRRPIWMIHAGRRDNGRANRVRAIDWDALFVENDFGNYLETLRQAWLDEFDLVLVDSHPGISATAGICTINLPDAVVAVATADPQGLAGIVDVARRARLARRNLPFDRGHLVVIPVLARRESRPEYQRDRLRRTAAASVLSDLYADFVPSGLTARDALEALRLPNIPSWEFGERAPVSTERVQDLSGTSFSYGALARLLSSGLEWDAQAVEESYDQLVDAVSAALTRRLPYVDAELGRSRRLRVDAFLEDVRGSSVPLSKPSAEQFVSRVDGQVATLAGANDPSLTAVCATLAFMLGDPPYLPAAVRSLPSLVDRVLSGPSGRDLVRALGGRG